MQSTRLKIFQAQKNMVANRMTGRSGFNFPAWYLFACVVLFGAMLPVTQVLSAIIQQPIIIDGDMSDWTAPADITNNPGQSSTDGESLDITTDLDYPVQGTGRDLKGFSFTYDATNLYMWVERYASTNNKTDWWFYIDTDNDGLMESTGGHTDKLLGVAWTGSNGKTTVTLYDYVEAVAGGDSLVCPATGTNSVADGWCPVAGVTDGYDMPGTDGAEIALSSPDVNDQNGGSTSVPSAGVEMETRISWAALGFPAGPSSIGFHISTSNGPNIPTQINDNMGGAGGGIGVIEFSDLEVTKTASVASVNAGSSFSYTVTVTNNGGSDATNVLLEDVLPAEVTYISDTGLGSYIPGTGLWTIGSLVNGATANLNITVSANLVPSGTVITNTASNLLLDQADPDTTNNQASVDVTVQNQPDILVLKSALTIEDPVNGGTNPKSIPGAIVLYTITIINQGPGAADFDTVMIADSIPTFTELFVGDLGSSPAGSPVAFIDGSISSGLSLSFINLASGTDDIEFTTVSGLPPVPDVDGYDAGVTDLGLLPKGTFAASDGTNHPSFTIMFKVRLQ